MAENRGVPAAIEPVALFLEGGGELLDGAAGQDQGHCMINFKAQGAVCRASTGNVEFL